MVLIESRWCRGQRVWVVAWGFFIEQFLSAEEQSVLYGDPNEKKPSVAEQLTMKNICAFRMAVYCKKQNQTVVWKY